MEWVGQFAFCVDDALDLEERASWEAALVARSVGETELQFYTRRAMEESRLAKQAPTAAAAAAHSYLAAAYSARIAEERAKELEFEAIALQIA